MLTMMMLAGYDDYDVYDDAYGGKDSEEDGYDEQGNDD